MIEVEVTSPIIDLLNQYGFATVAAIAMGWFIYFIYNYVTGQIIEKLDKAQMTTIALIDRIRMLDNDLIRLRSKLNTVLEMRENEQKDNKRRESDRISKGD
jgi:predicted nucleotide-binding protein (sugar kinase/HSP70/actin superfamily)